MKNKTCMNCNSPNLKVFLDLGKQPNGNSFPNSDEIEKEIYFPFAMQVCQDCWQVQIEEFPSPEFMFNNHPYITGVNMPVIDHFYQMVDHTLKKYEIEKNSLVFDIGCNDGTLLKIFREKGMRTLGIDPGKKTGQLAKENGTILAETFWTEKTARAIKELNFAPKLITATSVFYHIQDIHDFIIGLKEVMGTESVFMTQCVYLRDVLNKNQFDHFYHEHTMIHAIGPLKRIFEQHGFRLLDVHYYNVHGGSFVLNVGLQDCIYPSSPGIDQAIENEKKAGLFELGTYQSFAKRVDNNCEKLIDLLQNLKNNSKTIDALGAPLKGSTLLNYCNIGPDLIRRATEVNPFKIGKVTPGTHIPIVEESDDLDPPDYYLLLAWNFLDFFKLKYRNYLDAGGKFIVPHPEVQIIGTE